MVTPVRFLHTADWQLGMTRHFLDADAQPRYTAARIDAIGVLAELAHAQRCEFVLVCGDVFEGRAIAPRVIRRAAERLAEFDIPVYLLPGNHDPLDAASIYTSPVFRAAQPEQVRVLDSSGPIAVRPGVEIVAAPWFSKRPTSDLVADVIAGLTPDGTTRILAGHGKVDVLNADRTDPTVIATPGVERALAAGTLHYVALGDRHSTTSVSAGGRIWYSGTPVATDYDEVEPGQALVVQIDESVSVARHPVGSWTFADLVRRLDGGADADRVVQELAARPGKDITALRLTLSGSLSLGEKADWDDALERLRQVYAAIEVWEKKSDLTVTLDAADWSALAVEGYAGRALAELAAVGGGSDPEAATARDALSLAYRLSRSAR